ncbi:MAG: DUF4132 domain-containing protein [Lachnospiraceae bacterium]|nr:DUF4132 domain-containing protein [Lachnospiraceae bacterium]
MNSLYDNQMLKLAQMLQLAGATEDETQNMVAYVMGEKDATVLDSIKFKDISGVQDDDAREISRYISSVLHKKKDKNKAVRIVKALFAMGESTCMNMLPYDYRYNFTMKDNKDNPDFDKTVWALYNISQATDNFSNNPSSYYPSMNQTVIFEINDPEVYMDMYSHYKNQNPIGKAFILADYFVVKYPYPKPGEEKKLLVDMVGGEEKDIALMAEYERILLDKFNRILSSYLSQEEADRVTTAIMDNVVDDEIKKLAKAYVKKNNNVYMIRQMAALAYMNYGLSNRLKSFASLFIHMSAEQAIYGFDEFTNRIGYGRNITQRGGEIDDELGYPTVLLIRWAAGKNYSKVLSTQLKKNKDIFLSFMESASLDISNKLMEAIKSDDKALYDEMIKKRSGDNGNSELKKAVDFFISTQHNNGDPKVLDAVRQYLMGEAGLEVITPYKDQIRDMRGYYNTFENWDTYIKMYDDKKFEKRASVFRYFFGGYQFENLVMPYVYGSDENFDGLNTFFENAREEGLDVANQLEAASILCQNYRATESSRKDIFKILKPLFYEENTNILEVAHTVDAYARYICIHILGMDSKRFKMDILSYTQDTSKQVKEELLDILADKKEWEEEVTALLNSKKQGEREIAIRTLAKWDENVSEKKYAQLFAEALEKEKSDKLRKLIMSAMEIDGTDGENESGSVSKITAEDMVKELHKGNKKRSLEWAYETPFSQVHTTNGELATDEYLQAICLSYSTMEVCGISQKAAIFAEKLNADELAVYANELFDKWMEKGAEAKKKWVLYFASIHGGFAIVERLKHQINEWPQASRGAIAAEAVKALALNPLPEALLIVDGISRKFKFKQVKSAAAEALEYAAAQLGLTTEELADKIVPNLGFDENCERVFDYGTRKFKVVITPALELMVSDENGKKLKNLPAVGQKDDAEIANASLAEYKQMKKQLKTTITSQKSRLELALSIERTWTVEAWSELFVKNPIMHQFAIGLIWGIYEDGKLVQTFRYMEDGSFNTEDEDEYELPAEGKIGLVHPVELTPESRENWKQQLEDYEISQPFEQLDREIFYMTEEEKKSKYLERFGGYMLSDLSLNGKLLNSGWYRGSVQDAGGFDTYYQENTSVGVGAELHFSGSFVGGYYDEDVTVYEVRFYKPGTIQRGSYMYDEVEEKDAIPMCELSERYFSEMVLQLKRATASSKEVDTEWKAHKGNY